MSSEEGPEFYEATLKLDGKEFVGKGESVSLAKKGAYKRAVKEFQKSTSTKYIFF